MITDQAKEYLYNRKDESTSIIVQSKLRNLQQEEIHTRETIKEKKKNSNKNKKNWNFNKLNWKKCKMEIEGSG